MGCRVVLNETQCFNEPMGKRLSVLVSSLSVTTVIAAGFEKSVNLSARSVGMGQAVVGQTSGAESLIYNPAGLVNGSGTQVSASFSPVFSKFSGPIVLADQEVDSDRLMSPVFGVLASHKLDNRWAVGLGTFVAGGTKAVFRNINFSPVAASLNELKPRLASELSILDASMGVAYQVHRDVSVGVSWRGTFVRGKFATIYSIAPGGDWPEATSSDYGLLALRFNELSANNFAGFRIGAQYQPSGQPFGFGLNIRTPVGFRAKSSFTAEFEPLLSSNAPSGLMTQGGSIEASFPTQIAVGGYVDPVKSTRLAIEYAWTGYSAVEELKLTGTVTLPSGAPASLAPRDIKTDWKDQHNFRVGVEHRFGLWAARLGWVGTSQVTPDEQARATFASPGFGQSLVAGVGTLLVDSKLAVDFAMDYSFASGETNFNDQTIYGDYSSSAVGAHLTLTYNF
jgi:long-subunit fatty acid transport protein